MKIILMLTGLLVSLSLLAAPCTNDQYKIKLNEQCLERLSSGDSIFKTAQADEGNSQIQNAAENYARAFDAYYVAAQICNAQENSSPMGPVVTKLLFDKAMKSQKASYRLQAQLGIEEVKIEEYFANIKNIAKQQILDRKTCSQELN